MKTSPGIILDQELKNPFYSRITNGAKPGKFARIAEVIVMPAGSFPLIPISVI